MDEIENALQRARRLLRPERARTDLVETDPLLPPEQIGAQAGIGFVCQEPHAAVSVYVLTTRGQYASAVEKLKAAVPLPDAFTQNGLNGPLVFFGYTDISGPAGSRAKFRLYDLLSAFSGDE